jgi:hypothetical protein
VTDAELIREYAKGALRESSTARDRLTMRPGVGVHYPACQNCGERMRMIRRGPRHDATGYYEHQVFACGACDHRVERNLNTAGRPHERPRHQSESEAAK